jgi:phosphoribosylamine--glycine ligase
MRLKSDLADIMMAIAAHRLHTIKIDWDPRASVCVVMASGGYPGPYEKGHEVRGLEEVVTMKDVMVFHAGTKFNADGYYETSGGRVLGVTSIAEDTAAAIDLAYEAVAKIDWEGCTYRRDIGHKALHRPG